MCLVHAVPHIQNYYLPHSHCYEQDSDSLVNLFVPARPSMIIWALHPELQLSGATPCLKSQPGLVNWIGYWETFCWYQQLLRHFSLCSNCCTGSTKAQVSILPQDGPCLRDTLSVPWGEISTPSSSWALLGHIYSNWILGPRPGGEFGPPWWFRFRDTHSCLSHCSSFFTSNSISFFFLAVQEILHLSALSAPRFYFPILFFPLVTRSSVFLLPFLCPHELRSLELTIISKVVVKPSAESRFFSQALNICQQTLRGCACYHNRLCGKTQPCLSHLPGLPRIW